MNDAAIQELAAAAVAAADRAYAPYSEYRVGAALLTSSGKIFNGCNVENASYGLTTCAERNAVAGALAAGERDFAAIAIAARGERMPVPCGACRQVLAEFCWPGFPIYVVDPVDHAQVQCYTLSDLIPHAFG